ncbi:MAG: hypothetical protein D3922_00640 [Candidatus Electrothrix sp. AR1]|nr:hypothetical protein [Candidatus Electrothrix sp. AR1]
MMSCKLSNFSILYKMEETLWSDQKMQLLIEKEDDLQVGILKLWEEDVAPELIKNKLLSLGDRVESFMLGMKFIGNRKLTRNQNRFSYYINKKEFLIRDGVDIDIEAIIRVSKSEEFSYLYCEVPPIQLMLTVDAQPISLPVDIPSIPLACRRYVLTSIQAEELDEYSEDYQDEKLKRWFLILEELVEGEIKDKPEYKDIKYARDFISHPVCNNKNIISFLKTNLPGFVTCNKDNQSGAQFSRDDPSHLSLVSKYEKKARDWAKTLIEQQVAS